MKCPKCGGKMVVSDTVQNPEYNEIMRRRLCVNGHSFFSVEKIVDWTAEFVEKWQIYHR